MGNETTKIDNWGMLEWFRPPVGVAPLSFIPAGRLGLGPVIGGTAKTKWRQIALVGGGPKASMGVVVFGRNRNRDIQP